MSMVKSKGSPSFWMRNEETGIPFNLDFCVIPDPKAVIVPLDNSMTIGTTFHGQEELACSCLIKSHFGASASWWRMRRPAAPSSAWREHWKIGVPGGQIWTGWNGTGFWLKHKHIWLDINYTNWGFPFDLPNHECKHQKCLKHQVFSWIAPPKECESRIPLEIRPVRWRQWTRLLRRSWRWRQTTRVMSHPWSISQVLRTISIL